ncbi:MAG: hypothetical protein Q9160_009144 [Pyrenula sp. 1 TL-2023]
MASGIEQASSYETHPNLSLIAARADEDRHTYYTTDASGTLHEMSEYHREELKDEIRGARLLALCAKNPDPTSYHYIENFRNGRFLHVVKDIASAIIEGDFPPVAFIKVHPKAIESRHARAQAVWSLRDSQTGTPSIRLHPFYFRLNALDREAVKIIKLEEIKDLSMLQLAPEFLETRWKTVSHEASHLSAVIL